MPRQDSHNLLFRSFSDRELNAAGKIQFAQNIASMDRERGFSQFWSNVDLSLS